MQLTCERGREGVEPGEPIHMGGVGGVVHRDASCLHVKKRGLTVQKLYMYR